MRKQFSQSPWSPTLAVRNTSGNMEVLLPGGIRSSRPRFVVMLILLTMLFTGIYVSAMYSSKQSSSTSRVLQSREFARKNSPENLERGIESKALLSSAWWSHSDDLEGEDTPPPRTLVLYIFSNTDPEYIDNLRFYVRTAIREDDGCQHVIVINSGPDSPEVEMPELPSNAKYLHHSNECYDWGTFGWALEQEQVQVSDYKYFIFLNSSVRGPFIPPYLQGKIHFSELMTSMINLDDAPNSIKMVGPSINCEGTVKLPGGLQRSNPHVQSFAVAVDQTGMQLLIDDGKVFGCYDSIDETIYHSELGSSDAILRAGYNIGSFMSRYQGVNWLDEATWNCNDGQNPFNWGAVDIYSLQPMELMFVKVKHWALTNQYPSMLAAVQYDKWSELAEQGKQEVTRNMLAKDEWDRKAGRILKYAAKGPECWDCDFYRSQNEDLASLPCHDAYAHFVNAGQFEPTRPFRYTCETDWAARGVPFNPDSLGGTRGWPVINATFCEPDPNAPLPVVPDSQPDVSVEQTDAIIESLASDDFDTVQSTTTISDSPQIDDQQTEDATILSSDTDDAEELDFKV